MCRGGGGLFEGVRGIAQVLRKGGLICEEGLYAEKYFEKCFVIVYCYLC